MGLDNTTFWRIKRARSQAHSGYAAEKRNEFKDYFLNKYTVPWQYISQAIKYLKIYKLSLSSEFRRNCIHILYGFLKMYISNILTYW